MHFSAERASLSRGKKVSIFMSLPRCVSCHRTQVDGFDDADDEDDDDMPRKDREVNAVCEGPPDRGLRFPMVPLFGRLFANLQQHFCLACLTHKSIFLICNTSEKTFNCMQRFNNT